jgi:hypothetical protein
MLREFESENLKGKDHVKDLGVDGRCSLRRKILRSVEGNYIVMGLTAVEISLDVSSSCSC